MRAHNFKIVLTMLGLAGLPAIVVRAAPAFSNADFEGDGPMYNTGYNTFKTPVTNWTLIGSPGSAGIAYYTNDAYTTGTGYKSQILGMLMGKGVSQTVSGFGISQNYVIVWEGNTRSGNNGTLLMVAAGDSNVWSEPLAFNSGAFLTYTSRPFTALSGDIAISFGTTNGDMTALLDNLLIQTTTNLVGPYVEFVMALTGNAAYGILNDPYVIAPYEPPWYLRMQQVSGATMTMRGLAPGNSYQLSFYARNRAAGSPNDFRVSVDNMVRLGGTNYIVAGTAWTNLAFNFTATGNAAVLKFEGLNSLGGDRTVCLDSFNILTNPPLPLTAQVLPGATGIGTTNATLRGMLDSVGGGENPLVVLCWGTADGGTTSTGAWNFAAALGTNWGAGQLFETNVTGLLSGTGYYYRCFASNSAGTDWSDDAARFTTLMLPVVTNTGSIADSIWAILQGAITVTGGDTPYVWLYYWPDGGASTSVVALGQQSGSFQSEVAGLTTNTAYDFAFMASNNAGAVWSVTRTFTTFGWPAFANARFEDNGPSYNPTVNTFKSPITNWDILGSGGNVGVMCTNSGDAYTGGTGFKSQVLGICGAASAAQRGISQNVVGFDLGQRYILTWDGNCRAGTSPYGIFLTVAAGDNIVWSDAISKNSGSFLSYTSRPFTAASTNLTVAFYLPFTNSDQTVLLDNLRILPTTNALVTPFVDLFITTSGGGVYSQHPDGYGVTPYEGDHQLRVQMVGSGTMTIRELKSGWNYQVSYFAANRSAAAPNDFRVSVDGMVKTGGPNFTVEGTAVWTNQTFPFTSTGTTASLTFEGLCTLGGDRTVFFDGFSVSTLPRRYQGTIFIMQ